MTRAKLTAAVAALTFSGASYAQTADQISARGVVQIRCALPDGEMKATGFVWPEPGFVVTALHAVAGCDEVLIYSEVSKRETLATQVARAHLEADLALLRIDDDLGLKAVPFQGLMSNTRDIFYAWGYPHVAAEMIDLRVEFAGGLKGITTLGTAFEGKDLRELFKTQPYPGPETQIMRVTTTLQPGHSGAPIFDTQGRVVAIADGGLLGGWRGINWSIPAHVYLPKLRISTDPVPAEVSAWSGLYSAVTAEKSVTVATAALTSAPDTPMSALRLVRRVPLTAFEAEMRAEDEYFEETLDFIRAVLGDEFTDAQKFDIYEDPITGATIGVPAGVELRWNDDLGAAEYVVNRDNVVFKMTTGVHRAASFDAAMDYGRNTFAAVIASIAELEDSPSDIVYETDPEYPDEAYYEGDTFGVDLATGNYAEVYLEMMVLERDFLGSALYIIESDENFDDKDEAFALIFEIGANYLTDFALN